MLTFLDADVSNNVVYTIVEDSEGKRQKGKMFSFYYLLIPIANGRPYIHIKSLTPDQFIFETNISLGIDLNYQIRCELVQEHYGGPSIYRLPIPFEKLKNYQPLNYRFHEILYLLDQCAANRSYTPVICQDPDTDRSRMFSSMDDVIKFLIDYIHGYSRIYPLINDPNRTVIWTNVDLGNRRVPQLIEDQDHVILPISDQWSVFRNLPYLVYFIIGQVDDQYSLTTNFTMSKTTNYQKPYLISPLETNLNTQDNKYNGRFADVPVPDQYTTIYSLDDLILYLRTFVQYQSYIPEYSIKFWLFQGSLALGEIKIIDIYNYLREKTGLLL